MIIINLNKRDNIVSITLVLILILGLITSAIINYQTKLQVEERLLGLESENESLNVEINRLKNVVKIAEEEKIILEQEKKDLEVEKKKLIEENKSIKEAKAKEAERIAKIAKENKVVKSKQSQDKIVASAPTRGGGGRAKTFTATAYDLSVESCGKSKSHPSYGITASGYSLKGHSRQSAMAIAVDPRVIPLGSTVHIQFPAPYEHFSGNYTARDTGGAIKGNIVDIFMGEGVGRKSVFAFGRRQVKITY